MISHDIENIQTSYATLGAVISAQTPMSNHREWRYQNFDTRTR